MKLQDTIPDMISDDYRKRFVAECEQLLIRIAQTKLYLIKRDAGVLEYTPTSPRELSEEQLEYMEYYLSVLMDRAPYVGGHRHVHESE